MSNLIGRVEEVEMSQLGLQQQVTKMDRQTSARFEQMLQVVTEQNMNLAEQNRSMRELMKQWNRPNREISQQVAVR